MASHDFHNSNGFLIVVYRSVHSDFPNCGSYIFCRASESRSVVGEHQVVVNGFRNADKADIALNAFCIAGKLAYCIHRVVAADVEEAADAVLFKLAEKSRIYFIAEIFGKFIAAGAEIRTGSCLYKFKFAALFQRFHIHDIPVQEALDSVYHAIYFVKGIALLQRFGDNSVQACIDDCCWSAGLSDDYIFFHVLPPVFRTETDPARDVFSSIYYIGKK